MLRLEDVEIALGLEAIRDQLHELGWSRHRALAESRQGRCCRLSREKRVDPAERSSEYLIIAIIKLDFT
jgi:hypothetical protein